MKSEFLQRLVQADLRLLSPKELDRLPSVVVPIRGKQLKPEEIKYILQRCGCRDQIPCYRIQAAKDFMTIKQRRVCTGEWGGIVDSLSFVAQNDNSWVESGSFVYNSQVGENSLIQIQSSIIDSHISKALIEKSQVIHSKITESTLQNCEVSEYCTLEKTDAVNCRLYDRVWLEDVTARHAQMVFVAADNSFIYFEKLKGDVRNVNQLKLHGYRSPKVGNEKAASSQKLGFWQRLKSGDWRPER